MSGNVIYQTTVASNLKETLDEIVDDKTDGLESGLVMPQYFEEASMSDAFVDDLEVGGPGMVPLKPEGTELELGSLREGVKYRVWARTYGMKMMISDEAKEDYKYPEVIKLARRLKRALYKTVEYEAAVFVARGWDTNYPMGDGVPIFSASHPLPNGGVFSNNLTPVAPSHSALVAHRAAALKLPGHDGFIEGYDIKKVVFPQEQWGTWDQILGSSMEPVLTNFAAISVVKKLGIKPVAVKYWTNTTSNYFYITEAEDGLKWRWRRKPKSKTWVDNDQEVEKYGISARWGQGISEPRAVLGVQQ